jgi:YD repeat-containing protein
MAQLNLPAGEAVDAAGDVYIADSGNNRIQEIAARTHTQYGTAMTGGDVYTVTGNYNGAPGNTGNGGPAAGAMLAGPQAVAVSASGDLYIADAGNNRIQEIPATSGTQWGQSMTGGDIYTVAGSATSVSGHSGDSGPAASALPNMPQGVSLDKAGDLYIADAGNNRVQEVPAASGTWWGQSMTAHDMYTVAGSAAGTSGTSGDGGPAVSALLHGPAGVTLSPAGDLYIADNANNRIQEMAAATGTQRGQTMAKNDIYTIAGSAAGTAGLTGNGGPAGSALLHAPAGIAADSSGNLYIADGVNNRIQEIPAASGTQWAQSMTAAGMYTVAGSSTGTGGGSGDGAPAGAALLSYATGVSVDPAGNLYVTDLDSNRVREVTATAVITITTPPGAPSSLSPAPGGITVTQPGGAQVTFQPQSGGTCTAPLVTAGGYCAMPQVLATLTYNSGNQTYTFTPAPGSTFTYGWNGALTAEADAAGDTLTITYATPAPGTGGCPATAAVCETVTAASGRTLVIGSDVNGLVTSVTDPLGRQWTYAYTGPDLTSVKDPLGHVTTYTYGPGPAGGALQANDLLTITSPNAQPGGPDAGHATVNVYDAAGQVTTQTDPAGYTTSFNYSGLNASTGNGTVTVTDPDGNTTVDDYTQGVLAAQSEWTGSALVSEKDYGPATTAGGTSGGTLLDTWTANGNGGITTYTYDAAGNTTSTTDPAGDQTTQTSTALDDTSCSATAQAASACSTSQTGPSSVTPGGVITPPSSAPPRGVTYTLYDTDGNTLYTTNGVYQPGSSTASYLQTTYSLYKGNSITLGSTNISCTATPPSNSLPCATINPDGVVTQLGYDTAGDLTSSAAPDGNGSEIAKTTYGYDGDGEQTSKTSPDGNLSGANAGNYTTTTYNADGEQTTVTQAGGTGATVTPRTTTNGYDANGNNTTVQDARGYTTTTAYNADDKPTLLTDPVSNATLTCYDGGGHTTETVPPIGVVAGSLTPASCPASYPSGYGTRLASDATTYTYDAAGNKTATTTPAPTGQTGSETTTYTYDADGNVIKTTAPPTTGSTSQATVDTYTSTGQQATQTTGYGTSAASTTSYCYDPDGQVTSVVMPDGNTGGTAACEPASPWVVSSSSYPTQAGFQTTSAYDSAGELVSTTGPATAAAPSGATATSTYDAAGNTLTRADADGVSITWTYTPAGKQATVTYSGSSAHSVSSTYDANGQQTAMTDATGSSSYIWDPFGELTSAANGAMNTVGYSYDADGNATGVTYPLPGSATWATTATVAYGYNHADVLTSVIDFNNHQITITPNADSLPASETLGSTGDTITATYDPNDTPSAITLKNTSTTLQSFTYTDAPAGNITSETDIPTSSKSPAAHTYDAKGRSPP